MRQALRQREAASAGLQKHRAGFRSGTRYRPLAEARQGPPVRKRLTYWTLRRRVSAPVTHHGLDGFVTSLIADARNARFEGRLSVRVFDVAEVVAWAAVPLGIRLQRAAWFRVVALTRCPAPTRRRRPP